MVDLQELANTPAKELSDGHHQVAVQLNCQCFTPPKSRQGPRVQQSHLTLTLPFPPELCNTQTDHLDVAWVHVVVIPFSAWSSPAREGWQHGEPECR